MDNYELQLEPVRVNRNPITGKFLKGNVPHNKGKKWSEWMDGRKQRKVRRLIRSYPRPKQRSDSSGRPKRPIIAVLKDGQFVFFPSINAAARWAGVYLVNIYNCARLNRMRNRNTHRKVTAEVRTDHHYKGIRFYYEDDPIWMTKIKRD